MAVVWAFEIPEDKTTENWNRVKKQLVNLYGNKKS